MNREAGGQGRRGRLHNKVAIVTGSSCGIGRAIALSFHHEGARVVCADIRETAVDSGDCADDDDNGDTTHGRIDATFIRTDVTNAEDMARLVRRTVELYGRLDVFVNNAGIHRDTSEQQPIWAADEDAFDQFHRVNTKGVFLGCKYASAQMRIQEPHRNGDRGWIISISSVLGLVGTENAASYCASKGAVNSLTKAVALDCAPYRIHVNAICPSYTLTRAMSQMLDSDETREQAIDLHPFRGLGIPDDIARVAVFLASEDASWVTGVAMPVDGGYTAR